MKATIANLHPILFVMVCASVLLSASCSRDVIVTGTPATLTGPSGFTVSLSVQAVPDSLPRDGSSKTTIVVEAIGSDGLPARLLALRAEILVNGAPVELGTLSPRALITGTDGKAQTTYTAPARTADLSVSTVTVRVTASGGDLRADVFRQVDVRLVPSASAAPVPAFVVTPNVIVARLSAAFDASGTTDDGARCSVACSFAWNFGDNTTGSGETATHAYATAGSYVVVLAVTDSSGVSATTSRTISVQASAKPTADFSFSPASPVAGQDIFFNAVKSSAAAGRRIVAYDWNFGSGRTGSGLEIIKGYNAPGSYVVTLTVTDDGDERAVMDRTVTVVPFTNPTAVLTYSPASPNATTTVFFDASASTAPLPATISSYSFNFGDGTGLGPTTTPNVTHSFAANGTYVVRLTVTDSLGHTGTTTVSVPVISVSPVAVLTFSPQDPRVGATVFFDGNGSTTAAPATITSSAFDFGDGTGAGPAASRSATHVFTTAATYLVRLTVTDSAGRSATTTGTVVVRP